MKQNGCSCAGDTLDRLLRPAIMAVLAGASEGLHGYLISHRLKDVPMFRDSQPDATGLYRTLRAMESEGHLKSAWEVDGPGPARHVYLLTAEGYECLRRWADTLESYAKTVQRTVRYIEKCLAPFSQGRA